MCTLIKQTKIPFFLAVLLFDEYSFLESLFITVDYCLDNLAMFLCTTIRRVTISRGAIMCHYVNCKIIHN